MTTTEVKNEKQWQDILLSLANSIDDKKTPGNQLGPHFLQSWPWGELKKSQGWRVQRFAVTEGNKTVGAFQLLSRRVSRFPRLTLGYAPRGPVVASVDYYQVVLGELESVARKTDCFMVKVDPDLEVGTPSANSWQEIALTSGWRYSPEQIQPRATGITELLPKDPQGEEKLLANMSKTWRYNIRLGPKRGVVTEAVKNNDFQQFYGLYQETGQRQGFGLRSMDYYQAVADQFTSGYKTDAQLFVATHAEEKSPLAGAFLLSFGNRWWYFYGASSQRRRADMPTYCLQWTTQRWARDHGGTTYDWWGAPEDPSNKQDSRYSVWHFKKGFGPRHLLTVGAYDKPLSPLLYFAYMSVARYRKSVARLLHRLPF